MEEHEYFLEQLMKNKDLIEQEKISNIQSNMDDFLLHPSNQKLRDELKEEYIHMLRDILDEIEEHKIEEFKLNSAIEAAKSEDHSLRETLPPEAHKHMTRKEMREKRQREKELQMQKSLDYIPPQENKEDEDSNTDDESEQDEDQDNEGDNTTENNEETEGITFEDMFVGKLIDAVDFLSKWTNAIVTRVDKKNGMITVIVDGNLEMQMKREDINTKGEEIIAPFESKTEP
mmetsp:Transcript_32908/g.37689  ORF Transcript_32908/g.37689 Transcript_32908/m.37689 type:complete len:231 (+) Transcript_32908:484-1176(+)